jgi:hypothetical protein
LGKKEILAIFSYESSHCSLPGSFAMPADFAFLDQHILRYSCELFLSILIILQYKNNKRDPNKILIPIKSETADDDEFLKKYFPCC